MAQAAARSRPRLLTPGTQPCISISAVAGMPCCRREGAWAASLRALGRRVGLTPLVLVLS